MAKAPVGKAHSAERSVGRSKAGAAKVQTVMHEWGKGALHSGSPRGPKVSSQKQAVAIALSEARKARKK